MKRGERQPEYTLNVYRRIDEASQEETVVFLVQTTRVFVSFRYEILLASEVEPGAVRIDILGLHAPSILMPESGPARGFREFAGLNGMYLVSVRKQDKSVNEFEIKIAKKGIEVVKTPSNPFIGISTEAVDLKQ